MAGGQLEAFGRGAGQGATAGWGDEAIAAILARLPSPRDNTGIPRTYAAGSAENDYLQGERNANSEAQHKYPLNYGGGQLLGGVPLALSVPAAGSVAGGAAIGGAMGALSGAGHSVEGARGSAALRGGATGAVLGGAVASAPAVMRAFKGMDGPPPGAAPAMAGGGFMSTEVRNVSPQISINRADAMPPSKWSSGEYSMPEIPRPGKLPHADELANADNVSDAADNLLSAANQRLVERSYKTAAKRTTPIDVEAERLAQRADRKIGAAPTARPGKRK